MNPTSLSRNIGEPIIKAFESCLAPVPGRPGFFRAYLDPVGVVTIGWGTTNEHGHHFKLGDVWSQAECDAAFRADMEIFCAHVTAQLRGAPVTQAQFDALVSWAYNTGGPANANVWVAARAGNVEGTCRALMMWVHGGGKVLPGLVRRRKAECQLYRGDIDGALATAETRRAAPAPTAQTVTPIPVAVGPAPAKPAAPVPQSSLWVRLAALFKKG